MSLFVIYFQKPYVFGYDINDYDPYGRPDVHSRHEESDGKVVKGNIVN